VQISATARRKSTIYLNGLFGFSAATKRLIGTRAAPLPHREQRAEICELGRKILRSCELVNVAYRSNSSWIWTTVSFYVIEVNQRVQVKTPRDREVHRIDIVQAQI